METRVIGSIGVDSGQVFITDPCYIKHTEQGNGQWNLDWKEEVVGEENGVKEMRRVPVSKNDPTLDNKQNFYTKVCEANKDGRGGAEVELGVVVATLRESTMMTVSSWESLLIFTDRLTLRLNITRSGNV